MELSNGIWLASSTAPHPSADGASGWSPGLARPTLALKRALAPDRPFAIGLSLSGRQAQMLDEPQRLADMAQTLQRHGLLVTTVNSAAFCSTGAVPMAASKPDWRMPARRDHTLRLARILAALVPEGGTGGVSTIGLADKALLDPREAGCYEAMVDNLIAVITWMARQEQRSGRRLHVDLEPDPGSVLESPAEVVQVFEQQLLALGVPRLAKVLGISHASAETRLRRHLRVSLDAGAIAAAFEHPAEALSRWERAGIAVGQIKLTTALKAPLPASPAGRQAIARALSPLRRWSDRHPVVARFADGTTASYGDLGEALDRLPETSAREWRVRYALPVQEADYGPFLTTQAELDALLARLSHETQPRLLTIETAPPAQLPGVLTDDMAETLLRAYRWTLGGLAGVA